MKLSESQLQQIETAVKAAEARTRGEIVPLVLERAEHYPEVGWRLLALGALATGWWVGEVFWEVIAGGLLTWSMGWIPAIRRWLVGTDAMAKAVSLRAAAEFTRHGVMNTEDRCGILLVVSLFEHRAEILADRGIHSQVPEGYWKQCLDRMMAKVKPEGLTSALCSGITELGDLLAEKFPREAGSTNELADHLRRE